MVSNYVSITYIYIYIYIYTCISVATPLNLLQVLKYSKAGWHRLNNRPYGHANELLISESRDSHLSSVFL